MWRLGANRKHVAYFGALLIVQLSHAVEYRRKAKGVDNATDKLDRKFYQPLVWRPV